MWLFLTAVLLTADPDKQQAEENLNLYTAALKKGRDAEMQELSTQYKYLQKERSRLGRDYKQIRPINKQMKTLKERYDLIEKGDLSDCKLPELDCSHFSKGQIGYLPGGYEIQQVIDDKSFSALPINNPNDAERFHVVGITTTGRIVDGKKVSLSDTFIVTGTTSYTTVLGAKKTVFVLEVFYQEPYLTELMLREQAAGKTAKAPATRKAKSSAASQLRIAKKFIGKKDDVAKERLQEIIDEHPDSDEAKEAKELLKGLGKARE